MQRLGALVMPVLRKLQIVRRDAEVLQDAMLQFVFEHPAVTANDELTSGEVEHDASPRPFLVFCFQYNGGQSVGRASGSPTFPEVVVVVRAGEEVAVYLSVGHRAAVCNQEDASGTVLYEPVGSDIAFPLTISGVVDRRFRHCL
jgi:hypothetical protein